MRNAERWQPFLKEFIGTGVSSEGNNFGEQTKRLQAGGFMACFYGVIPSIFKMLFLLSAFILSLSPNCSLIELSKNCLNVVLWVSFPTYMLLCRSVALKSTKIIRGGA